MRKENDNVHDFIRSTDFLFTILLVGLFYICILLTLYCIVETVVKVELGLGGGG